MKHSLATAVLLCAGLAALGRTVPAAGQSLQTAHPAVVRVTVPERGAVSYGSGTLVAADQTLGLVVTNWHVVRDAAGPITVAFPDGFRSTATLLATDREWDLAALAIRRPNVRPVALADQAPQQGESLTIAGYGQGTYRASTGRCTQYVSPGHGLPFEMVELDAAARQGDSGGPILNRRGELAGVLFGAGFGRTAGSYSGRVRTFLDSVAGDFQQLSSQGDMIARRDPEPDPPEYRPPECRSPAQRPPAEPLPVAAINGSPRQPPGNQSTWRPPATRDPAELPIPRPYDVPVAIPADSAWSSSGNLPPADVSAAAGPPPASQPAAPSTTDQIKTVLAAVGALAIAYHGLRLLGAAA